MTQQYSQATDGIPGIHGNTGDGRRIPLNNRQQGGMPLGNFLGPIGPIGKASNNSLGSGGLNAPSRPKQNLAGHYSPRNNRSMNQQCQVGEVVTHNVPFGKSSSGIGNDFSSPIPLGNFLGSRSCSSGSGVDPSSPFWLQTAAGMLPEMSGSGQARNHGANSGFGGNSGGFSSRSSHRDRRHHYGSGRHSNNNAVGGNSGGSSTFNNPNRGGNSLVPSPPPPSLGLIQSMAGDTLMFSETNMDWTKLNIFRTRLCDRLTQTHSCHMVNRCLFSHDVNWPRRTPFLPRATALTLRYIPVWCPRLEWPPLVGLCDSEGKITWTSSNEHWDPRHCHQNCSRGDNCPFVHNLEEFLYHPEVYKTRTCCLANDGSFEEQMNSSCMALCPWYFCPFAHEIYELRDLRGTRYAWHPPPQIVDNQFVARTQGFDELEMQIIDFIRKAPNGSYDLYSSPSSPLKKMWRDKMPPVIRPMKKTLVEELKPSLSHLEFQFDDLLYVMIIASFLNLLLYPVENFYVPTLLSLQGAVLRFQLGLPIQQYESSWLVQQYDSRASGSVSHDVALNENINESDLVDLISSPPQSGTDLSFSPVKQTPPSDTITISTSPDKIVDLGSSGLAEGIPPNMSALNRNQFIKRWASSSSATTTDHSARSKKNELSSSQLNNNHLFYGSHPSSPIENRAQRQQSENIPLYPFDFTVSGAQAKFRSVTNGYTMNAGGVSAESNPGGVSFGESKNMEGSCTPGAGSVRSVERAGGQVSAGQRGVFEFGEESLAPTQLPPPVAPGDEYGSSGESFLDDQEISGLGSPAERGADGDGRGKDEASTPESVNEELRAILELLEPEELIQMMEIIATNSDGSWTAAGDAVGVSSSSSSKRRVDSSHSIEDQLEAVTESLTSIAARPLDAEFSQNKVSESEEKAGGGVDVCGSFSFLGSSDPGLNRSDSPVGTAQISFDQ